ncbi:GNAT family N-acetyltransferase [Clostridium sp. C2-6-12]|uniref:GNAT family N-acetyltransferase n=1 Tax=Clostridium sp. C2-6-12 TaxID=2698832 RepID=UPI00136BE87F|nr:GNAT family N-acetyltransferase [Clostridium sp. C2-6-12]
MINLRIADLSDTKQFAYIKAEAYSDDRSKSKPDEDNIPEWYNGEWFKGLGIIDEAEAKRLIENYYCYMILLEETPIGVFWLHHETEGYFELEDFCILPAYQGKGYGTIVLKLMEELYPDNKTWMLGTPYFCRRNRHLYEKVGYAYDGTASNDTVILYKKCI